MPFLNPTQLSTAFGWLVSSRAGGLTPQEEAQAFRAIGGDVGSALSWLRYHVSQMGGAYYNPSLEAYQPGYQRGDLGPWFDVAAAGQRTSDGDQIGPQQRAQNQLGFNPNALPSGVDPNTVSEIVRAARDVGVDPRIALAIAYKESGLNAQAIGDDGTSFGVFQLHRGGELDSSGLSPSEAMSNVYQNAVTALTRVKQVQQQHPDWDVGRIAREAQGADPAGGRYASDVNNYLDSIQSGQGPLSWAQNAVQVSGQVGLTTAATRQYQGSSDVPLPFPTDYFRSPSLTFGQNWEGETEQGIDYPMPEGTQLFSPVGGTVHLEDSGGRNWGKRAIVTTPNGWSFAIGHMMDFAVSEGEIISAGSTLGTSGGGPQSSSPGFSNGPHIEAQFIDPSGQFQNPQPFLQGIFSGTTFGRWMGGMFLGSAQVQGQKQDIHRAPDGALVDYNTPTGQWYKVVDGMWQSVFGQHAPLQAALDFRDAGVRTTDELTLAINNLPSNIPGVSIGQFKNVSDAVLKQSQAAFGRPVPQSLINEFFKQGITTSADIQLWFDSHSSSDIPQGDYQSIYDAMTPYSMSLTGDVAHPNDVVEAWLRSGGSAPSGLYHSSNVYTGEQVPYGGTVRGL